MDSQFKLTRIQFFFNRNIKLINYSIYNIQLNEIWYRNCTIYKKLWNIKNEINKSEFKKIINKFNKKIDLIDTASSYGESENLQAKRNKKYKIITKLDKIKSKSPDIIISEINYKLKTL